MQKFIFDPFPVLSTPRLTLRQPLLADAPALFPMRSDPEVMRYIPRPLATKVEDVEGVLQMVTDFAEKGERINWLIEWKETKQAIGLAGYVNIKPDHSRAELGYSLDRAWHRKGIMREAVLAILAYGFDKMMLHTVEAIIDVDNTPSGKLLENVGFRQEAFFREDFRVLDGTYRDSVHYGMLEREYRALKEN